MGEGNILCSGTSFFLKNNLGGGFKLDLDVDNLEFTDLQIDEIMSN